MSDNSTHAGCFLISRHQILWHEVCQKFLPRTEITEPTLGSFLSFFRFGRAALALQPGQTIPIMNARAAHQLIIGGAHLSNCMHAPRHAGDSSRTTLTRTCRPLACHIGVGKYAHPKFPRVRLFLDSSSLSLSKSGGSPWTRPCSPPRLMNNIELGVGVVTLPCHCPHSDWSLAPPNPPTLWEDQS